MIWMVLLGAVFALGIFTAFWFSRKPRQDKSSSEGESA